MLNNFFSLFWGRGVLILKLSSVICHREVSFPDMVDSRFPERVDTLLEFLTPLLKRLAQEKPHA